MILLDDLKLSTRLNFCQNFNIPLPSVYNTAATSKLSVRTSLKSFSVI